MRLHRIERTKALIECGHYDRDDVLADTAAMLQTVIRADERTICPNCRVPVNADGVCGKCGYFDSPEYDGEDGRP